MALVSVGVDVVDIDRMARAVRSHRMCQRCFTEEELAYAAKKPRPEVHLAARFAAKEALAKALGVGLAGIGTRETGLSSGPRGATFRLGARAKGHLQRLGGKRVLVSLSHEKGVAIAMVVIEG